MRGSSAAAPLSSNAASCRDRRRRSGAGRDAAVVRQLAAFAALGVGCAVAAKSALLLSVSWPSGRRIALEPGAAVVDGAVVGCPSPRPFAAVPYATASV